MDEEVMFHDLDILSGKIDPDKIQSRYVYVYAAARIRTNVAANVIKAANLMAKYGWKVVGITTMGVLLERE
ncbi:MAG: hypothetical protein ACXADB_01300 [Candidatus Hermodarchaeia archaeon]|jgi:hypothetical protein